ncbi:MAG TPA: hypothetical protein VED47_10240 [Burkholderiaceae bacterium]|nr:hypothetical protein [Burkholderiaceae bacterium]
MLAKWFVVAPFVLLCSVACSESEEERLQHYAEQARLGQLAAEDLDLMQQIRESLSRHWLIERPAELIPIPPWPPVAEVEAARREELDLVQTLIDHIDKHIGLLQQARHHLHDDQELDFNEGRVRQLEQTRYDLIREIDQIHDAKLGSLEQIESILKRLDARNI